MKKLIFWKFFAGFFFLSVFLALAFYLLIIGQVKAFYLQTTEESLERLGMMVSAELAPTWTEMDPAALDRFIKQKGVQARTRFTVVDLQGRVLADSQQDPLLMQNHSDRPEIAAALSGRKRSEIRFSLTLRENMLYFAQPLPVGGKTVAVLRLSVFFKEIEQVFTPWRWKITTALLGLLCLSLFFSFLLSRNLSRPIRDLAEAARRVASGTMDGHVHSRRRDEIGQLTADFNAMVDSQKNMVEKLRYNQQELETILASISDGLLVIDAQERITRAGPRFCRLVGDPNPLGKPYWEVLRHSVFDELVKKTGGGQAVHAEIEINQRLFLASLSPLPAKGGIVVTFHDLSETRKLEKVKKDFIANVSHELRTPLTAIKGYAETLIEESAGDVRKYLDVILRHTDRLIGLTADLLALSELEEKSVKLSRESIDWPELLDGIRALFENKINEKKLSLNFSFPESLEQIAFKGDRFRLEQMLINLMDNAVRYTDQGGIHIRLAVDAGPEGSRRGGRLLIEFRDSGVGIPAEHLPRIFERFYVVDKARSRQSGGTGLGLAIVKHIVSLHGGEIEAQSLPGSGCTFSIRLPFVP